MKKRTMQIIVALGLMAFTLSAQAVGFRLPEFMNAQQLTVWRAQHSAPIPTATSDEQAQFFTGKPFDAASGTYQFKYRAYNPAIARWTSADPSGFPDGANNLAYAPIPTSNIDVLGLFTTTGQPYARRRSDMVLAALAPAVFLSQSASLSARACSWCIGGTSERIADLSLSPEEQSIFTADPAFGIIDRNVARTVAAAHGDPVGFTSTAILTFSIGDLATAIHSVDVHFNGTITPWLNTSDNQWYYNGNLTISFSDPYDFHVGDNALVNVFARLDAHHWLPNFSIVSPANWQVSFSGHFPE